LRLSWQNILRKTFAISGRYGNTKGRDCSATLNGLGIIVYGNSLHCLIDGCKTVQRDKRWIVHRVGGPKPSSAYLQGTNDEKITLGSGVFSVNFVLKCGTSLYRRNNKSTGCVCKQRFHGVGTFTHHFQGLSTAAMWPSSTSRAGDSSSMFRHCIFSVCGILIFTV